MNSWLPGAFMEFFDANYAEHETNCLINLFQVFALTPKEGLQRLLDDQLEFARRTTLCARAAHL